MDKNIEKDGTQAVTEQENVRTPVSKNVNTKAAVFNKNLNEETIHTDASASTLAEFLIHQDEYVKKQHEKKDFAGEEAAEYQKLIDKVKTYITDKKSLEAIREAYELADKAHSGQIRATGEPYIVHPLAVAYILAELEIDTQGIIAALLHDVVEDTDYTLDDIKMLFGDEVAFLVDGVTKLSQFHYKDKEDQQLENFRKMFLAMAKDIRVVVIKLADRLHNMRTLGVFRKDKQQRIARETIEIYAPLAHRLGIYNIKWELEDLCFHYLHPDEYYDLVRQMKQKRKAREEIVNDTMRVLHENIEKAGIQATITGRPKHFYSIYKKMKRDGKDLSQIYDLYAVRVIVDTIPQCYAILGIVHTLWKPLPNRFKDYIAVPKPNMYQSLHTTVIGTKGQPVEIQIRTWEMHHISEYGVAAHWRYKEGKQAGSKDFDTKISWLRRILEWQDTSNPKEFMNALKLDVFSDEVFVFTPKGDVTNLPKGSIPIDFAYRIHTEVGNRCVGAKINNKIVPLDTKLKNGDIVSIITSKTGKPSYDWINMVGAADSKAKIRSWFKKENKPENIARGQELLIQEADRLGFEWKKLTQKNRLEDIAKTFNNITEEDLLASVGYGGIPSKSVILKLAEVYKKELNAQKNTAQKTAKDLENLKMRSVKTRSNSGILVKGEEGLVVHLAKCCNPVPGDNIVGFVTRGRGVSVHCVDCPNAVNFPDKDRMIDVSWEDQSGGVFLVTIEVISYDRTGLMADILAALTEMKLSVSSANVKVENSGMAVMNLGIQIKDLQQLDYIMTKVRRIKGVHSVRRMRSAQQGEA
ncbi:RelA/SpoT family protein [Dialister hominis]|jgi:guanosine-3',5'-bis(diphosphate) 3'-pyrophosphohydrolase|uniref:GTP diphosphokinase n=4 Tax=Dialister TaxID=39948 RepID=A0A8D4UU28_9FIRM|nr:bifunctional (p)ppGpp synthetase/guanosine-3',5'-bis(diphosphate) 3'-pyrophosphohydrolase [Dialister hominis]UYJ16480.1 MAG: bifunctional (p)ppGpp synthetase/guanosine-3',5'-bis(diphosphate) 3'-pyrophosphohydrolase [Veillonellaceae bacterium]BBK24870.1 (p)ppGpp synthetase [Dialister hominis]